MDTARIAVLGASGYTGGDLLRLLAAHPFVEIGPLTGERQAGRKLHEVFPHLLMLGDADLVRVEDVVWAGVDAAFCALPHAASQEVIARLPRGLKIVDLSADFRLSDPAVYAEWYGREHQAPALQLEAVYGLTERNRDAIRGARLVANPGCYPTAALLALLPLLTEGLIKAEDIIIDAKSGVSGAGRGLKEANLFCEVAEGMHPYGVGRHRHMPEIEQELSRAHGGGVTVNFTPHLVPMNRGELVTCYVRVGFGTDARALKAALAEAYAGEYFVRVAPDDLMPATRHVRGSNLCLINVFPDRLPGRAIVIAVIDNLIKGAAGQAIQNLNVMMGWPESLGLEQMPQFP